MRFLGIDPSGDPVRIANEQGIPTLHDFFTEESARRIRDEHGTADAISAAGVFGHIADLASVMRGVDALLAPEGVFLTENQYWLDMVERLHYDNMFHQHLRYYSMRPLLRLYADYGLEIFDVRRSEVYGGSITVLAGQAGEAPGVAAGRRAARGGGGGRPLRRAHVAAVRERGRGSASARSSTPSTGGCRQGEKVVGIGAPAKASTVCNYCRLGPELVDYVTEINPLRIGMFLPGVHIPIVDEELLFSDPEARRRRDLLRVELRGRDRAEAPRARLHGRADSALNQATVSARPSSSDTRGRKPEPADGTCPPSTAGRCRHGRPPCT